MNIARTMLKTIRLLFLSVVLFSCQPIDSLETITIDNKYSISIPSFLTRTHDLSQEASLQYQDARKGFYFIVMDQKKKVFREGLYVYNLNDIYTVDLSGFTDYVIDGVKEYMQIIQEPEVTSLKINGLNAKTIQLTAHTDQGESFISMAIIDGKGSFYWLMTWARSSKEKRFGEIMNTMIQSFNEL